MYTNTTEADRLQLMFERGELSLNDIIAEAVSDVIDHALRHLSFHDGSEWVLPYPWAA